MQKPLLTDLETRFGKGALKRLSDLTGADVVSTTIPQLDAALCTGGIPRNHLSVMVSQGTAGAATLTYRMAAGLHQSGEPTALVDVCRTFDPDYATMHGVHLEQMILIRGKADRSLETVHRVLPHIGLLILTEPLELTGRLRHDIARSSAAVVMLSTGEVPADAAVVIEVEHCGWIRHRRDVVGYRSRAVVRKNRFAPAGQTAEFAIQLDGGGL